MNEAEESALERLLVAEQRFNVAASVVHRRQQVVENHLAKLLNRFLGAAAEVEFRNDLENP